MTAYAYQFYLHAPETVFACQSLQAVFGDNFADIIYDNPTGDYTDVWRDDLVLVGSSAGADDLGRARIRKAPTSGILYLGWVSRAVGEGAVYALEDAYITVLRLPKPWVRNPRILDDGTIYMDYDRQWSLNADAAPILQLGIGPGVHAPLDAITDEAEFTFSATALLPNPDATAIATWAWTLPAAATVTAGAIDEAAITFTLPEGAYVIRADGTDDVGVTGSRVALLVAGEPPGTVAVDSIEREKRIEGQTLTLRVLEPIPPATYPNGTLGLLWRSNGDDEGPDDYASLAFAGWHHQDDAEGQAGERGFITSTTLELLDTLGWLALLPAYNVTYLRDTAPERWDQMKEANIDRMFARLLTEYSNALTLTDFQWSGLGSTYPFPGLSIEGSTLAEQGDFLAQAVACKLTSNWWGRLRVWVDPQLVDHPTLSDPIVTPSTRTTAVQATLTTADWSRYRYTYLFFPRVNWIWEECVIATAVDYDSLTALPTAFNVAPGKAPGQGTSQQQHGQQLATTQSELNARSGHRWALENNPLPSVELELVDGGALGIDPAVLEWVNWELPAALAGMRDHGIDARFLAVALHLAHDAATGTQTASLTLEQETLGTPAETVIYPPGDTEPYDDGGVFDPTEDGTDEGLFRGQTNLAAIDDAGLRVRTTDFGTPGVAGGPTYDALDLELDGTVLDAKINAYSPEDGWVVTTTSIYYVENIGADTPTVTLQLTFDSSTDYRTLHTERGTENHAMVVSYYNGLGVKTTTTSDGSTWGDEVTVTSYGQVDSGDGPPPGTYDWAHEYNFALDDYGWTPGHGAWVDGVGFTLDASGGYTRAPHISKAGMGGSGYLTYMSMNVVWPSAIGGGGSDRCWMDDNNPGIIYKDDAYAGDPTISHAWGATDVGYGAGNTWTFWRWYFDTTGITGDATFQSLIIAGTGVDPWPADPGYSGEPETDAVLPCGHVFGKTAGKAYCTAFSATGVGALYECDAADYGEHWALSAVDNALGDGLGGCLHAPWAENADETRAFWTASAAVAYAQYRTEAGGASSTLLDSGAGALGPAAIDSCPDNALQVVRVAADGTDRQAQYSAEGGVAGSWQALSAIETAGDSWSGCATPVTGLAYFWGDTRIGYCNDLANGALDDRSGNLAALGVGKIMAIAGFA